MKRVIAILSVVLGCLATAATAATVSDLYEAVVPVEGEDIQSRNRAIGAALGQVLVRLTGREPAPGRAELIPQAARYVQQFRYRRETGSDGETQIRLWVRFDKTGLDRVMRDKGLPLWGNSRPGVLVWLATDVEGKRQMIGIESELAPALHAAAETRGLPVQLPLHDLDDQTRLTSADLWSDYAPAVLQASERYSQPLVLTGRLRQVAVDHWAGRWTLYEGTGSQAFESTGEDAASAVTQVVGQITEILAMRYAPAGGQHGPEALLVRISGVQGLADYARAVKLISERQVVDRVALRSAEDDSLLLEVMARGGRDGLSAVLDLVRELKREPDPVRDYQPLTPVAGQPGSSVQPTGTEPFDLTALSGGQVDAKPAGAEPEVSLVYSLRP